MFVEFTRLGETGNYVVLATICSMLGVYLLVIIWARKADMLDERKVNFIVYPYFTLIDFEKYRIVILSVRGGF